jgi:hypothetical protein
MDIVLAGSIFERRAHFLDRNAAVRELGMTGGAGSSRPLSVLEMAGKAAQAFVHADGSTVIARMHLMGGDRSVALIAERLPLVGAELYDTRSLQHCGEWQLSDCDMGQFPAIEKSKRRSIDLLLRTGKALVEFRFRQRHALAVKLMTRETRHHGLFGELRLPQVPGSVGADRDHQIADPAMKVHGVTAQAVIRQKLPLIMVGVQKDVAVRRAVPARAPFGKFLLMTFLAPCHHLQHVFDLQQRPFRRFPTQVNKNAPHVVDVEAGLERKHVAMAL